jgi:hypothetical protein
MALQLISWPKLEDAHIVDAARIENAIIPVVFMALAPFRRSPNQSVCCFSHPNREGRRDPESVDTV